MSGFEIRACEWAADPASYYQIKKVIGGRLFIDEKDEDQDLWMKRFDVIQSLETEHIIEVSQYLEEHPIQVCNDPPEIPACEDFDRSGRGCVEREETSFSPVRPRKVYVASSWRNKNQGKVVEALEADGHEVYDFKHPHPGNNGFHWSSIDPQWKSWTSEDYRKALDHRLAKEGFDADFSAMKWADAFVLVLPCGRSAHLELGWACGMGKQTLILLDEMEPELMARMVDHICGSLDEVRMTLSR